MSGRFSAPPPPRKRSSRPSLSLYLDFPLMSPLTLAACDHFPLSRLPLQVRVRARRTASAATTTTTTTAAEFSVGVGVCIRVLLARARGRRRRRRRAWVSRTHGVLCLQTSSRLVVAPQLCVCACLSTRPLCRVPRRFVRSFDLDLARAVEINLCLLCCVRPCCGAQATAARSALFVSGGCGCGVF